MRARAARKRIGIVAVMAALAGCNGEIGASGGGGATGSPGGSGGGGATGTTTVSSGGSGGVGAAGGGGAGAAGGQGGSGAQGGQGGSGGTPNEDPCAGAADGSHCGGALGGLADHNSVYTCAGGVTTSVMGCANGCESGGCKSPPADPCANANAGNGAYCNASLGAGDDKTLYQCQNGMTLSKMVCPNGCKVQPPGVPDSCHPSGDPCANAGSGNGLYCGAGISGDPNKLYNCQGGQTASFTECEAGCQVNPPGVADACAASGGGCCLNKPPGVLTQSYTACGSGGVHYGIDYGTPIGTPIYAGMSGTVVAHALGYPNCYMNGCTSSCWNAFNYVKLKADCGDPNQAGNDFFVWYLHIDGVAPGIGNGTHVNQGQLLAYSGNSGCSSGPHIHIETASVPAGSGTGLNTCKSENPATHYCQ